MPAVPGAGAIGGGSVFIPRMDTKVQSDGSISYKPIAVTG